MNIIPIAYRLSPIALLSACGFSPIYATPDQGSRDDIAELSYVDIAPIANRAGQELRNSLLAILPPAKTPAHWRLDVQLSESIDDFGIRRDTTATFARMTVTAQYHLYPIHSAKEQPVLQGTLRAINSYNIQESTFATLTAEEDARSRASQQLAQDLKLRLAAYFKRD